MRSVYPPGPPDSLFGLAHSRAMGRDMMGYCAELQRAYGDVVHFRLGPIDAYQFTHPDHVSEVLIRQAKKFHKSARFKHVFGRFQGDGLLVSDGPHWLQHRRLTQPALAAARLPAYRETIRQIADRSADTWAGRDSVELYDEMMRVTLHVLTQTLFSVQSEDADRILSAVRGFHRWSIDQLHRTVATPRWWPLWFRPSAHRALRTLRTVVGEWVTHRRAQTTRPDDLLEMLLTATAAGGSQPAMSETALRDELVTIVLSGQESTAAALTWTGWLLATHPEVQERCAREANLPEPHSPRYIDQVFKESIRLYPVTYSLVREAVEPVEVAGYRLRAGSLVFLSPYLTQRDPRWFPDPESFDAERFSPEREAALPPCAWFPFGVGPRGCIGRGLALLQATTILESLLRRYRLSPAAGQCEPEKAWELSLRPKGDLRLRLEPRLLANDAR